jgi:DNA-binding transcriptional LysR family regulator
VRRVPTPSVLPDVSIRQLEYLVAVAESPTWSIAAATVGVSPSALSQGLAELERRVGVDLFEPVGRRRVVRTSAAPLLDHARQVVALTGDVVRWADRLRTSRAGSVALGMIDVSAVVHHTELIRTFRHERPDVDLRLTVAPSAALLDDLRSGALDVVVCVEPPSAIVGVDVEPLLSEPLMVLAPAGVRVGAPATWGPWVLFPGSSHTRQRIEAELRALGAPVHVSAESHQPDVLVQMVRLGLGWTVLPVEGAGPGDDVVVGPVLLRRQLVLARRAAAVHDPAADELSDRLRRHAADRVTRPQPSRRRRR